MTMPPRLSVPEPLGPPSLYQPSQVIPVTRVCFPVQSGPIHNTDTFWARESPSDAKPFLINQSLNRPPSAGL
jgi:hypothetical protein